MELDKGSGNLKFLPLTDTSVITKNSGHMGFNKYINVLFVPFVVKINLSTYL